MNKLSFPETSRLLEKARIPQVKQFLVTREREAVAAAKKLGFPLVMKLSSPEIIHKTESGGIVVGVQSESQLRTHFHSLLKTARKKKASLEGVLLQEQVKGLELIAGGRQDPQFGPVLMFGLGGIFVEVFKDVSFRLAPISRSEAREMIQEIRGYPLLAGARGKKPIHLKALENTLLGVSRLLDRYSEIQEFDINPLFATEKGAWAADVRILQ